MPWSNGYTYKLETSDAYLTPDDAEVMINLTRHEMTVAVTCVSLNGEGIEVTELLGLFADPEHAKAFIEKVIK